MPINVINAVIIVFAPTVLLCVLDVYQQVTIKTKMPANYALQHTIIA